jgi:hypothetical protein
MMHGLWHGCAIRTSVASGAWSATLATALAWTCPASAHGDAPVEPAGVEPPLLAPAPVAETTTPHVGPSWAVVATGALIFTATYVPMVAIGAGSGQSVDRRLYIPVAGPWIDLAERRLCVAGNLDCRLEIANKFLLATDGIFQGIGVLTALAGFIVTERAPVVTTARADGPAVQISPALGPGEAGVAALGTF